jgi:hypothetical protein
MTEREMGLRQFDYPWYADGESIMDRRGNVVAVVSNSRFANFIVHCVKNGKDATMDSWAKAGIEYELA